MKTTLRIATIAVLSLTTPLMFTTAASAHDNGYNHRHQSNNDDQLVGGLIGAVVGGVIGSQVSGNGARTEGSVVGAVIGGIAGAAIAGDGSSNRNTYNNGGYAYTQQPYYGSTYYTNTYYQPTYYRPYYSGRRHNSYGYSRPRVSININSGYGGRHSYGQRSFRNNVHHSSSRRRHLGSRGHGFSNRGHRGSNRGHSGGHRRGH